MSQIIKIKYDGNSELLKKIVGIQRSYAVGIYLALNTKKGKIIAI